MLYLDILDVYQKVFYGEESKSVNSRRVTFMSNAGSEQTSENLVDNVLCQLIKAWLLESLNALVLSIITLLNFFLIKICSF